MILLIPIEAFDNFKAVKDYPIADFSSKVLAELVKKMRELDERAELEPWLRSILADGAQTPHGPAEIVDSLTHHGHGKRKAWDGGIYPEGKIISSPITSSAGLLRAGRDNIG